jgi:hypothetical protein
MALRAQLRAIRFARLIKATRQSFRQHCEWFREVEGKLYVPNSAVSFTGFSKTVYLSLVTFQGSW